MNSLQIGAPLKLGHRWPSTGVKKASPKRGSWGLSAPGSKNFEKNRKRVENEPNTPKKLEKSDFRLFLKLSRPLSDFFQGEAFLTPVEGQRCPNAFEQWRPRRVEILKPRGTPQTLSTDISGMARRVTTKGVLSP